MNIYAAHAYSPRENVGSRGGDHLVFDSPISFGRIHRLGGEKLCSRRESWGLCRMEPTRPVSCPKCLKMAERHGVVALAVGLFLRWASR